MIVYKAVRSFSRPEAIRFDEKSVWVSTNIREVAVVIEGEEYTEYEFDQTRYTKDEYIKLIDEKNAELEAQVTDTQLALCELYEGVM